MQMSVEELFVQTEREHEFDSGFYQGKKEGKKEGRKEGRKETEDRVILIMLKDSVDDESILRFTGCTRKHLQEIKGKIIP